MPERRVSVSSRDGLHARPAALFVRAAAESGVAVRISKVTTGTSADARSILAVLGLDVRHGDDVVLSADGDDVDAALDRLAAMLTEDADAAA
jgi:phosphocarrier protein HPr